jgi:Holin of 3TMs, for gene-transfer release
MGWLSMATRLVHPARELIEMLASHGESEPRPGHAERLALSAQGLAALEQLAAGVPPCRERTRWDSFIDGLNRLPRPLITLGVLAFFVLALLEPLRFAQIARAYQLMPDGFWALLSVIVAFYFGGRMQLKRQDGSIRGAALAIAREIAALQRAARERAAAPPPPLPQVGLPLEPDLRANRVIEAWKRQRVLAAQG